MKISPVKYRGKKLFLRVMNHIIKHPEEWSQVNPCGTPCCVLGWVRIFCGKMDICCEINAVNELKISKEVAEWIFDPYRTLPELYHFAKTFKEGVGGEMTGSKPRKSYPLFKI